MTAKVIYTSEDRAILIFQTNCFVGLSYI